MTLTSSMSRNAQGTAVIGDPRNNSHVVMARLHLAFCGFHNAIVDRLRGEDVSAADLLDRARRTNGGSRPAA